MLNMMPLLPRVIPCLLLQDDVFVKTKKFRNPIYIGDPVNTLNLFNKFEVDEIIVLDIGCVRKNTCPDFSFISELASECWVPLSYGGGLRTIEDAKKILNSGIEKVVFESLLFSDPNIVENCVQEFGASSIVACISIKESMFGGYQVYTNGGTKKINLSLDKVVEHLQGIGVGELIINNISREGASLGYDLNLIKRISSKLSIPVVALGGASCMSDFKAAIESGASAVSAGSYFVFQRNNPSSVLINFPSRREFERLFL